MPDKTIVSYDPLTGAPIYSDGTLGASQLADGERERASEADPAEGALSSESAARRDDTVPTLGGMLDTLNVLMPDFLGDDNISAASPAPDAAVTSSAALAAKQFYDAQLAAQASAESNAALEAAAAALLNGGQPAPQRENAPASPFAGGYAAPTADGVAPQRREHQISAPERAEGGDFAPSDCAGFFTRLAAFALDSAIAWILSLIVSGSLGLLLGRQTMNSYALFNITLTSVVRYLAMCAYFVLLTGFTGATLGKRLLRIKVVSSDGGPLSWLRVIYRETVGRYLTSLLCVGYLVLAADSRHRGFHDMLADTRVVYCR